MRFLIGLIVLFVTEASFGEVRLSATKSVNDFVAWSDEQIKERQNNFQSSEPADESAYSVECVELEELPAVMVCLGSVKDLSQTMRRVEIYSGNKKGIGLNKVVSKSNPAYKKLEYSFGGLAVDSESARKFYAAVNQQCYHRKDLCLDKKEDDFYKVVVEPFSKKHSKFVLVGLADDHAFGHEILHAQFHINPLFKNAIIHFWTTQMSNAEKALVRKTLRAFPNYATVHEIDLINEFQAYILDDFAMTFGAVKQTDFLKARLTDFLKSQSVDFTNGNMILQLEKKGLIFEKNK